MTDQPNNPDQPTPPDIEVNLPSPESLKVTSDAPCRLLIISNLAGTDEGRVGGAFAEQLVEVNAENFDDLLAAANPSISFKTTDPLAKSSIMAEVELSITSLKDFQPAALLERLHATQSMMGIRHKIADRLRGKLDADGLKSTAAQAVAADAGLAWLGDSLAWSPNAEPASDEQVDDLLGQLDLGDGGGDSDAPPPKSPIGKMVAAAASAAGSQIPAGEASALRRTLAEIDRRASTWLSHILHAPQVQQLEARWRGLAHLVSNLEFRKGLRLSVLHADRESLSDRLNTLVIDPIFDEGAPAPAAIIVDDSFTAANPDVEILDELAQHAASLPAVVLTGVSHEFFGVKHAWQVPTLPAFVNMFDQWQFAKWKTLRQQAYARNLGVVFGRALLRAPFAEERGDDLKFAFREECIGEKDFLWTTGAMTCALTIARSFVNTGWPTEMVGRLEGFEIGHGGKKGDKQYGPADTTLSMDKAQEMAMAGLNAVISEPGSTNVIVCNGFSAARATRTEGLGLLEVSLPYQLFASRLSYLLFELKPHLAGMNAQKVVPFVLGHVRQWLTIDEMPPDEQQISVQAKPIEDEPGVTQLAVTVTPPSRILPGGIPIVLGYKLT